ncbi:MAG: DUF2167 domain-containing protein [Pasteurella oralis]|uniref:DUF2167 domain-containing protein n=1 Tax=Pasteurella oralis TaxID=1071947 RepID=UPI00270C9881|nr:DUF2167 domain-containing protein [Pasteurella oralis]
MFRALGQVFTKLTALLLLVFSVNTMVLAETAESKQKLDEIERLLFIHGTEGPVKFPLPGGVFDLPSDMVLLPGFYANQFMELIGNNANIGRLAIVMKKDDPSWIFDIVYSDIGYISDKEAKTWDIDALFEKLREGDKELNEIRREKGAAEIDTLGWVKKPIYDDKKHHLVWAINLKPIGPNVEEGASNIVNYNAYLLSRIGYIGLSFLTEESTFESEQAIAEELRERIHFNEGEGYEDFTLGKDKVAWFGISTLVSGTFGQKSSLFTERDKFFLLVAMIIIAVVLFAVIAFKRLLRRKALISSNSHDTVQ